MEDAATAEISRLLLWQWVYHGASTTDGKKITPAYVDELLASEAAKLPKLNPRNVDLARRYLSDQVRQKAPSEFLTSDLSSHLDDNAAPARL